MSFGPFDYGMDSSKPSWDHGFAPTENSSLTGLLGGQSVFSGMQGIGHTNDFFGGTAFGQQTMMPDNYYFNTPAAPYTEHHHKSGAGFWPWLAGGLGLLAAIPLIGSLFGKKQPAPQPHVQYIEQQPHQPVAQGEDVKTLLTQLENRMDEKMNRMFKKTMQK